MVRLRMKKGRKRMMRRERKLKNKMKNLLKRHLRKRKLNPLMMKNQLEVQIIRKMEKRLKISESLNNITIIVKF